MAQCQSAEDDLSLSIVGLGVEYPPYRVGPEAVETLARRHYPDSIAIKKVLSINRFTGIETRAAVGTVDHPLVNQPDAPSINELSDYFLDVGVRLSTAASRKAIKDWGGSASEITHVVSTTCTNSANPGFDYYVCRALGIKKNVEKILLHGIGCSGGLAAIRTASGIALGASFRRKPARVLVLACEICTLLIRSELDSVSRNQETRIGCCLFSDCASACIVSNGVGVQARPVYTIQDWSHEVLDDSDKDLGFDVDPLGWKVVLSPRVPQLATTSVKPIFDELVERMSMGAYDERPEARDFDWAIHPGGATILHGIQQALSIPDKALMAAISVYMECGNSSSATIMSVMDRLRRDDSQKKDVIALAFGPGILVEAMRLERREFRHQ